MTTLDAPPLDQAAHAVALESLQRRMRAMHSLWYDTMELHQVNHVERAEVLPIAFSLFHLAQIEDGSMLLIAGLDPLYDDAWGERMGGRRQR